MESIWTNYKDKEHLYTKELTVKYYFSHCIFSRAQWSKQHGFLIHFLKEVAKIVLMI